MLKPIRSYFGGILFLSSLARPFDLTLQIYHLVCVSQTVNAYAEKSTILLWNDFNGGCIIIRASSPQTHIYYRKQYQLRIIARREYWSSILSCKLSFISRQKGIKNVFKWVWVFWLIFILRLWSSNEFRSFNEMIIWITLFVLSGFFYSMCLWIHLPRGRERERDCSFFDRIMMTLKVKRRVWADDVPGAHKNTLRCRDILQNFIAHFAVCSASPIVVITSLPTERLIRIQNGFCATRAPCSVSQCCST